MTMGIRPTSLSEAIRIGGVEFALPLDEFLDEFYEAYPDREVMQDMINASPQLTGDVFVDSYVGAVGEHLALRWDLEVPLWVESPERGGTSRPQFVPDMPSLRPILLVESPYAFRRRNIFTGGEPLQRARWPREVAVYEPIGLSSTPSSRLEE
jgi:hypothetical protein